jgi:hypothetical protein
VRKPVARSTDGESGVVEEPLELAGALEADMSTFDATQHGVERGDR